MEEEKEILEDFDSYKFLFVDVDGTMLNSEKEVTEKTLYTFKKLKELGVEVVISSGRQRSNCVKIAEVVDSGRYVISANGADVYDRLEKKQLYGEKIKEETLNKLQEIISKYDLRVRIICGDTAYINKDIKNPFDETLLEEEPSKFFATHEIPQIVLYFDDLETFNEVKTEICRITEVKIINQNKSLEKQKNYFLDITLKSTSKGNGIKNLCKVLSVPTFCTVAIGDDNNDVSMFENVAVSIAMGNASQSCIEKALIVTDSNDEDGIYNACINLFDFEEFEEE